jgi:HepT-like protein
MSSYRDRILAEAALVEGTLALLRETLARETLERPEWMAAAGFLFNMYNGIENILRNGLLLCDVTPPKDSATSHRDLLEAACKHGVVSQALRIRLDEFRAFRHFFAHGYGVLLDPKQLTPLAEKAGMLWADLQQELKPLVREVD